MPAARDEDDLHWLDLEREDLGERSTERFDRIAFALQAIDLLKPRDVRVAVAPSRRRLRVDAGRAWGQKSAKAQWAVLAVPNDASRRSIALAVASLGALAGPAWALDFLMGEDRGDGRDG